MAGDSDEHGRQGLFWLASYPKSGNTWTRAFLANLLSPGDEAVNVNALNIGSIASSRAWIEEGLGIGVEELNHDEADALRPRAYKWLAEHDTTGYHKVHDAWSRLPNGEPLFPPSATRGAVYLARNPLDIVLSWANHSSISVEKSIAHLCDSGHALCRSKRKLANQLRQIHGTWSEHVLGWLDADIPKLVMRYEDIKRDPVAAFSAIAGFFEIDAGPEEVAVAVNKSRFENLRRSEEEKGFAEKAPRVRHFFRKGVVGDWRQVLTPAQVKRVVETNRPGMERLGYLDKRGRPLVRPRAIGIATANAARYALAADTSASVTRTAT
jgi:hypothetical protein